MGTVAQNSSEWPPPLLWLRNFLHEELTPYPGRGALVARMVFASTLAMLLSMTFRIPFGAYGAIFALTISRETPQATFQAVRVLIVAFAVAVAYVLLGAFFFSGEPLIRFVWVLGTFFAIFFALSAMSNYTAAARFGYLIIITTPLWDERLRAEQKVEETLWAIGAISSATIITAIVELVYARLQPHGSLITALAERLDATAALLRSWAPAGPAISAEEQVARLAILGTSRMRRDLLRSDYSPEYIQQMGAVVALVGRLIDLGATAPQVQIEPSQTNQNRMRELAKRLEEIKEHLLAKPSTSTVAPELPAGNADRAALLTQMERTTTLIAEVLTGSESPEYVALPDKAVVYGVKPGFFLPDAFTNPDHIRFAIRGGLAAGICYTVYNLSDWRGISTAVTTCFLTAMTTIGASRQKQILRFAGALVGGVFFGFGAQVFLLPALDSITGFLLMFIAVIAVASWLATASPRLSYFGVQVAVAFCLINLQEFKFQTSLVVARDRVVGILLGLLVMWLVFDRLGAVSTAVAMKRTFVATLRLLAQLMREPTSTDRRIAIEQSYTLREMISSGFEKLRQQADGVMLEFDESRNRRLALRAQLLNWQLRLRVLFLTRITLLKYRLGLPGFELSSGVHAGLQAFDEGVARALVQMADHLEGRISESAEDTDALLVRLEESIASAELEQSQDQLERQKKILMPLSNRIAEIVHSLSMEVLHSNSGS